MRLLRFLKAQGASAVSTAIDFAVTIGCVKLLSNWHLLNSVRLHVLSSTLGNIAGGITNFYLGRQVVFKAKEQQVRSQGVRYLLVWLGSMLLNASGMYLLNGSLHVNYLISKIVVSLIVGIGFNYFMQLYFVFRQP